MTIIRPAMYMGQELKDYGVCKKTGNIYSFKKKGKPHKLAWSHRNPKCIKFSYPCVRITDSKVFAGYHNNGLTINVHIITHETLCKLPRPRGVTKKEWRTTANSVKRACRNLWQVNHIDHNKTNFHPSNLEWVTAKENAEARLRHYSN